jgi:hypothetical protein
VDLADANQPFDGQLHEIQRRHYQRRGAFAPLCLELLQRLAGGVALVDIFAPSVLPEPSADAVMRLQAM